MDSPDFPRQRILDVALRLFDERGYAATSMEAIRVAAGFRTKSSLYAHFRSKEDLTRTLFRRILSQETAVLAPHLPNAATASLHDLLGLAGHLVAWRLSHRAAYRFCFMRWVQGQVPIGTDKRTLAEQFPDWATTVLARLQREETGLRPWDPVLLVNACQGLINQVIASAPDGLTSEAIAERAGRVRTLCEAVICRSSFGPPTN